MTTRIHSALCQGVSGAAVRPRTAILGTLAFVAAHVPLAIVMRQSSTLATFHALATFAVGFWWAASSRRLVQVAYAVAYIAGAEVLWRMTKANVFWEFGKYATISLLILAMLRFRGRAPIAPALYFALLLPSVPLTLASRGLLGSREIISFNLSGPFSLAVSALFFSRLELSREQLHRLYVSAIGPVLGIAAAAAYRTATTANIRFTDDSNFATSGGFGPNQVSSVLGLGALLAFLMVVGQSTDARRRALMFGLLVLFAAQGAMTFSRGGLYNAGGAAILAWLFLLRDPSARAKALVGTALFTLVAAYVVLPSLDAFTGGALTRRFQDTGTTGRTEIIQADLQIWEDNPLFGVGPGLAQRHRAMIFRSAAAHTEFSRLLAEHGIFGVGALLTLLAMAAANTRRARTAVGKATVAAAVAWAFLFMCNAAMRLVAPAFMFGLTCARLLPEEPPNPQGSLWTGQGARITRT